jgi:outer membrane protein OmpA-like peptidoglycan-associated protein
LDKKRVFAIYKYIVSKGINKERIERKYSNSQKLADTTGNKPQANRRAVITFK